MSIKKLIMATMSDTSDDIVFTFKGVWSSSSTYYLGDVVTVITGELYFCVVESIQDTISPENDQAHWRPYRVTQDSVDLSIPRNSYASFLYRENESNSTISQSIRADSEGYTYAICTPESLAIEVVTCLDPYGRELWTTELDSSTPGDSSDAVVVLNENTKSVIYVIGVASDIYYNPVGYIVALNKLTGELQWHRNFTSDWPPPVRAAVDENDNIYLLMSSSGNNSVLCKISNDGSLYWCKELLDSVESFGIVYHTDKVVVTSTHDFKLLCMEFSTDGDLIRSKYVTPDSYAKGFDCIVTPEQIIMSFDLVQDQYIGILRLDYNLDVISCKQYEFDINNGIGMSAVLSKLMDNKVALMVSYFDQSYNYDKSLYFKVSADNTIQEQKVISNFYIKEIGYNSRAGQISSDRSDNIYLLGQLAYPENGIIAIKIGADELATFTIDGKTITVTPSMEIVANTDILCVSEEATTVSAEWANLPFFDAFYFMNVVDSVPLTTAIRIDI